MARKAPPRGQAKRKASSAPKRKAAAAPKRLTAYQKRLRDYQRAHPGWRSDLHWRQKARGHKVREHVTRRERELDWIRRFADQQAARFRGNDPDEVYAVMLALYRTEGIGYLKRLSREIDRLNDAYVANGHKPLGYDLSALAEHWQLPAETLGYH